MLGNHLCAVAGESRVERRVAYAFGSRTANSGCVAGQTDISEHGNAAGCRQARRPVYLGRALHRYSPRGDLWGRFSLGYRPRVCRPWTRRVLSASAGSPRDQKAQTTYQAERPAPVAFTPLATSRNFRAFRHRVEPQAGTVCPQRLCHCGARSHGALQVTDASTPDSAARRWVPWLSAYTGARVGEITQLRKQDVIKRDGIHAIHITPEYPLASDDRDHQPRLPVTTFGWGCHLFQLATKKLHAYSRTQRRHWTGPAWLGRLDCGYSQEGSRNQQ